MKRPFLTARWEHLIIANFAVDDAVLWARVPRGLELDRWNGSAYVSLVAFQFLGTRVMGVPWPGFVNFPELNLRFYVRDCAGRRGVMFVREYVPSRVVGAIARAMYNEPYASARMSGEVTSDAGRVRAAYTIRAGGREHRMSTASAGAPVVPGENTAEHFFKEHDLGFGTDRRGRVLTYRVDHPRWAVFTSPTVEINVDWALLYGEEWRVMNGRRADSVVFARGSEVSVFGAGRGSR